MDTKRSTNETRYECRECGDLISPASYRARCPGCGGRLRAAAGVP